jgi:glycerol uptake facilitator-like aquaporin
VRRVLAEAVGTFVLVFFAVGSAVFGADRIGAVGVALAFGLVLLALAYALGPIFRVVTSIRPSLSECCSGEGSLLVRQAGTWRLS